MEGKNTAMICSGDAGVYGMAGLILELAQQYPGVRVRIVPGITAACAGAAVLGAPLMHDFAVISLILSYACTIRPARDGLIFSGRRAAGF